jgi:PIN domain nuclease of toxin-antitoxin system
VTGYLLDTNVVLLAGFRSAALSEKTRRAIKKGPNYVSVISYWEVILKSMKGKLSVGDPHGWWIDMLSEMAATGLPLRVEHVAEVWGLPALHQDPFDRVLIAQAMVERFALVTTDSQILSYAQERLQVIQ